MQDEVERALRKLGWQGRHIWAAGRTDTGVHACGQVIAFEMEWNRSSPELLRAINANLPFDIAVRQVQTVPGTFNPRRHALYRRYRYRIFCQEVRDPLRERYAWRVWPTLQGDLLNQSAQALIGVHDFATFSVAYPPGTSTVREVYRAGWLYQADRWVFEVTANAFLYHMVRRMVKLQVNIAQGKIPMEDIYHYLDQKPEPRPVYVQGLAPPNGLYLEEVCYPESITGENKCAEAPCAFD